MNTGSQIDLEIADHLGIQYFTVGGISGGGPHALASAHLAKGRCLALLIIAGLAPFDDPNFDFVEGLTEEDRKEWILPLTSMADFEVSVSKIAKEWASSDFNQIKKILNIDPDDSSSDERISSFQALMQYSFSQGSSGLRDDRLAFLKPWGFSLEEISSPVQLWVGTKDVTVPPAHSDYLNGVIPNSELFTVEGKNHFSISEPANEQGFKWLRGIFDSHV